MEAEVPGNSPDGAPCGDPVSQHTAGASGPAPDIELISKYTGHRAAGTATPCPAVQDTDWNNLSHIKENPKHLRFAEIL